MSGFPAYLYLENGELYSGIGFGIKKHETAEVVFNTALSGYQEIITDPSYAKQIITFTNPHIGNTGINEEDNEASSIYASGIVIRSLTEIPSSWRSTTSLQDFLIKNNSIGISGIDTRKLVNTLRETGSQRAIIAANDSLDPTDAKKELEKFSGLGGLDLAKVVSTKDSYTWDENTQTCITDGYAIPQTYQQNTCLGGENDNSYKEGDVEVLETTDCTQAVGGTCQNYQDWGTCTP